MGTFIPRLTEAWALSRMLYKHPYLIQQNTCRLTLQSVILDFSADGH